MLHTSYNVYFKLARKHLIDTQAKVVRHETTETTPTSNTTIAIYNDNNRAMTYTPGKKHSNKLIVLINQTRIWKNFPE
jgi:hypothetical protein